jgi:hypothetical protein
MIKTQTVYGAFCDNCGKDFENHEGYLTFYDSDILQEELDEDEWYTKEADHYCPNCYHIDDEDNLIIKAF